MFITVVRVEVEGGLFLTRGGNKARGRQRASVGTLPGNSFPQTVMQFSIFLSFTSMTMNEQNV